MAAQCRAARALVNWSQAELERAASVAKKTIADFEREARQPHPRTLAAIRAALEAVGVEFITENGGGVGVRLRKSAGQTDATTPPSFTETIAAALEALPAKEEEAATGRPTRGGTYSDG